MFYFLLKPKSIQTHNTMLELYMISSASGNDTIVDKVNPGMIQLWTK